MIDIQKYLNQFFKGTKDPSLKAMEYFISEYNNFERQMQFIHIAGTNGKGSCTEIISNILIKQGYKVGKFLSPHLIRYNERISINGVDITDSEMSDLIEELDTKIKKYKELTGVDVTLFELETTMALLYFYRNNVDFVVLETGLGGLYDCTNIITKPLVSVITSIGFDHMSLLGRTLPEIAYQKAGIIKENSDTVIFHQEPEVDNVFIEQCKKKNNKLHIVKEDDIKDYKYDENYQYFTYKDVKNIELVLKGKAQIKNASICIETIKILNEKGFKVDEKNIKEGMKTVVHKARMEVLNRKPLIVYDGAHNAPAIKNLQEMVQMYFKDLKRTYIISILKTKDYNEMLKLLAEDKDAKFILTSGNDEERYVSSNELENSAKKYINIDNICKMELKDAIKFAMKNSQDTVTLIVGSFYVYGTVVKTLKN